VTDGNLTNLKEEEMTTNESWIFQPWIINRWLEGALGFSPWFIVLVIDPILVLLLVFLLREICLKALFLFESLRGRKEMLRRVSFYLTVLLGILGVGAIWRIRMIWLSDSLQHLFETSLEEVELYLIGAAYAVVTTLVVVLLLYLVQKGFRVALEKLDEWARTAKGLRFQKALILSPKRVRHPVVLFLRVGRLLAWVAILYFSIPLILSYFPITAPFASTIMPYVTGPAIQFVAAIVGYLPRLVTLILIIIAIRYLLRFLRFLANALENEEIRLPEFEPDWADPTYKLVRSLMLLAALMISYPYLPGAGSDIFKGFSIFVGALVTLGASTAINNVISGIVLTYTRAFRVGDRVQIGTTLGDILEKKLFVTRLRTLENEEITMPNGMVLGGSIKNLSAAQKTDGLALQVSAGIGYDVDWRQVHALMKKGAAETPDILAEPEPFVLETELGDFAVNYTLFAYTDNPKRARFTSAQLRRNILDLFNAEGVEIMTPSVAAVRDGNQPAIPQEYSPKPFSIPGIQVLKHSGKA
jgi:small-conductance mechanosensitive channel